MINKYIICTLWITYCSFHYSILQNYISDSLTFSNGRNLLKAFLWRVSSIISLQFAWHELTDYRQPKNEQTQHQPSISEQNFDLGQLIDLEPMLYFLYKIEHCKIKWFWWISTPIVHCGSKSVAFSCVTEEAIWNILFAWVIVHCYRGTYEFSACLTNLGELLQSVNPLFKNMTNNFKMPFFIQYSNMESSSETLGWHGQNTEHSKQHASVWSGGCVLPGSVWMCSFYHPGPGYQRCCYI